jgi:hypothetical protein
VPDRATGDGCHIVNTSLTAPVADVVCLKRLTVLERLNAVRSSSATRIIDQTYLMLLLEAPEDVMITL